MWTAENLEILVRNFAKEKGVPFRDLCAALRVAVTAQTISPPLFKVMEALGEKEVLARIKKNVAEALATYKSGE